MEIFYYFCIKSASHPSQFVTHLTHLKKAMDDAGATKKKERKGAKKNIYIHTPIDNISNQTPTHKRNTIIKEIYTHTHMSGHKNI